MPQTRSHGRAAAPAPHRPNSQRRDPGAFIGRLPERAPDVADQPTSVGPGPAGHRQPEVAREDIRREAGQDR